jgi:hypothetical protein
MLLFSLSNAYKLQNAYSESIMNYKTKLITLKLYRNANLIFSIKEAFTKEEACITSVKQQQGHC